VSRSGYDDDCDADYDVLALGRWSGQVASTIRGKRGQAFLAELLQALDEMPAKRLIAHELKLGGEVCALGSLGAARGIALEELDPEDYDAVSHAFGITHQLVREIEWVNDDCGVHRETPESRWQRVRDWVVGKVVSAAKGAGDVEEG
jgi:hypothetical protein